MGLLESLKSLVSETGRKNIDSLICIHYSRNPPPIKVMLIAPPQSYPPLWEDCIFIFPMDDCTNKADARIFWQTSLADVIKCSDGTVEPAIWVCGVCNKLAGRGFEGFMRHRSSPEHTQELLLDEQEKMAKDHLKHLRNEERT